MKMLKILVAAAIVGMGSIASTDPIVEDEVYAPGNHPNGGAAAPYYGLRIDGLLTGNGGYTYTFDFEAAGAYMQMLWDRTAATIHIWSAAYGGQDIGTT